MNQKTLSLLGILIGGSAGWFAAAGQSNVPRPSVHQENAAPAAAAKSEAAGGKETKISQLDAASVKSRLDSFLADPSHDPTDLPMLMARWVATDLEAAKAWMRAFPDKDSTDYDERSQPLKEFFKAWAAVDPKAAIAEALAVGPPKTYAAQDSVILGLARLDFSAIKGVLTSIPDGANNPTLAASSLLQKLMARDRSAALELASTLKGKLADGAMEGIAKVWARTDPAAALAWAEQSPNSGSRKTAIGAILTEWARKDPAAVGPHLLSQQDGQPTLFHAQAATEAIGQLAASDPAEALQFAKQYFPADYLKANFNKLFFRLLDQTDGQQSVATMCACVNLLPPEALKDARLFANSWPSNLAPSWDAVLAEPDSPGRMFLLSEMGQRMCGQNLVKMIEDLANEPNANGQK
jgi:hypothetical protein